jgi:hypothetical protein
VEEAGIEEVRFGLVGFDAAEFGMVGIEEDVVFFAEDGGGDAQGCGGVGADPAIADVAGRILHGVGVPAVWQRIQLGSQVVRQFDREHEKVLGMDVEFEVNQQLQDRQRPAGGRIDERRPDGIPASREGSGAFT